MTISLPGAVRLRPHPRNGFIEVGASSAPIVPTSIAGLASWWKADALALSDGAKVSSWADSSGNGRTVTQGTAALQPVFKAGIQNGRPVVRCAGASEVLTSAGPTGLSGKAGYTIFYAYASNRGVTGSAEYLYQAGAAGADRAIVVGLQNINPGGTDGFLVSQYADDGPITLSNSSTFHVIAARKNGASGCQVWRDGSSIGTNALPSGTYSPVTDQIRLFTPSFGGGVGTIGDVGEILVYDSALSTTDRQSVESYLKARWGTP